MTPRLAAGKHIPEGTQLGCALDGHHQRATTPPAGPDDKQPQRAAAANRTEVGVGSQLARRARLPTTHALDDWRLYTPTPTLQPH